MSQSGPAAPQPDAEIIGHLLMALDAAGMKGLATAKLVGSGKKKEAKSSALRRLEDGGLAVKFKKGASFCWFAARHAPSAQSVAEALKEKALPRGAVVWALTDLNKLVLTFQKALVKEALDLLTTSGEVLVVKSVNGRSRYWIFSGALPAGAALLPVAAGPVANSMGKGLSEAYKAWRGKSGSSLMSIHDLQNETGIPLPDVHVWLKQQAAAGRAELSEGDWSLASPEVQKAALVVGSQKFIRVRLHENS